MLLFNLLFCILQAYQLTSSPAHSFVLAHGSTVCKALWLTVASSPLPAYQLTKSVIPSAMLFSHTSKRGNLLTSIHSFVFLCLPASELLTINYQLLTILILFCSRRMASSRHTAHGVRSTFAHGSWRLTPSESI